MSTRITRSRIGVEYPDGSIVSIYYRYHGYGEDAFLILMENYTTCEAAEKLVALGDLSELGGDVDSCTAYHCDRGETRTDTRPKHHRSEAAFWKTPEAEGINYLYLYQKAEHDEGSAWGWVAGAMP